MYLVCARDTNKPLDLLQAHQFNIQSRLTLPLLIFYIIYGISFIVNDIIFRIF